MRYVTNVQTHRFTEHTDIRRKLEIFVLKTETVKQSLRRKTKIGIMGPIRPFKDPSPLAHWLFSLAFETISPTERCSEAKLLAESAN